MSVRNCPECLGRLDYTPKRKEFIFSDNKYQFFDGPTESSPVETGAHGIRKAEDSGLDQSFKMRKFKIIYETGYCNEGV